MKHCSNYEIKFWSYPYCSFLAHQSCHTVSGPEPNKACIFPFTTPSGIISEECTNEGHDQFWCQTSDHGYYKMWGNCGPECKTKGMFLGGTIDIITLQIYTGKVHWKYSETAIL